MRILYPGSKRLKYGDNRKKKFDFRGDAKHRFKEHGCDGYVSDIDYWDSDEDYIGITSRLRKESLSATEWFKNSKTCRLRQSYYEDVSNEYDKYSVYYQHFQELLKELETRKMKRKLKCFTQKHVQKIRHRDLIEGLEKKFWTPPNGIRYKELNEKYII